jgi:aminopeptidase-like protein
VLFLLPHQHKLFIKYHYLSKNKDPMNLLESTSNIDLNLVGDEMYQFISELFPICRSITGSGVRETLERVQKFIPVEVRSVATGTPVFDWNIPREWNIKDAYIKNSKGERIVDFQKSNLHVVNYSVPVREKMSLSELKEHLYSMPEHPDWIPYRTSYYNDIWGFCLTDNQLQQLPEDEYEVCIDSDLSAGHLNYGELELKGESDDEVVFFCHICHPSLCNDNLTGIAVATFLARYLLGVNRRYTYRFIFAPATIGSITWLAQNKNNTRKIKHGLVLSNLGDAGHVRYKKSRQENADIDKIVNYVLQELGDKLDIIDFSPYGYDERQFCSPGFNLPVGRFTRSPNGGYPQYHTSADNLDFVKSEYISDSFHKLLNVVNVIEKNANFVNLNPFCEPQLGRRGIYHAMGGLQGIQELQHALLWILNLSDGSNSLLDICQKSKISFDMIHKAAVLLQEKNLIDNAPAPKAAQRDLEEISI